MQNKRKYIKLVKETIIQWLDNVHITELYADPLGNSQRKLKTEDNMLQNQMKRNIV